LKKSKKWTPYWGRQLKSVQQSPATFLPPPPSSLLPQPVTVMPLHATTKNQLTKSDSYGICNYVCTLHSHTLASMHNRTNTHITGLLLKKL